MSIITNHQLESFRRDGYLICENVLDVEEDIFPIYDEYDVLLDRVVDELFELGELPCKYKDLEFKERVCMVYQRIGSRLHGYFDISLPQKNITPKTPVHNGRAVFKLIKSTKLLDMMEIILGPEIYSNPTQHVRIKPPSKFADNDKELTPEVTTTVWHQDLATVAPEADDTEMVTVWIPLTEANRENGCLLVAPKSHKRGLAVHCIDPVSRYSRQAIPEKFVGKDQKAVLMQPGDVLLLDKLTMHASLPNLSESIRWSIDLRYQKTGWPTGRSWFPGFVVRSEKDPTKVLKKVDEWAKLWDEAKKELIMKAPQSFQRWENGNPDCA